MDHRRCRSLRRPTLMRGRAGCCPPPLTVWNTRTLVTRRSQTNMSHCAVRLCFWCRAHCHSIGGEAGGATDLQGSAQRGSGILRSEVTVLLRLQYFAFVYGIGKTRTLRLLVGLGLGRLGASVSFTRFASRVCKLATRTTNLIGSSQTAVSTTIL